MAIMNLTKEQFFERVGAFGPDGVKFRFKGSRPAVVDFYAAWCGPCRMLAPVFEELSVMYAGKVDFYKVNVDEEQELSALFSVRSIPTLLFIPLSGHVSTKQGAQGKPQLKEAIESILLK